MPRFSQVSMYAALLGIGYLCGSAQLLMQSADAQPNQASDRALGEVRQANQAVRNAMRSLESEGAYSSIMLLPNSFLVLAGGGNALADLESGNGVDPETFAALYAAMAISGEDGLIDPFVKDSLAIDAEGRVTYNNEVVKLYSRQRLQRYFAERLRFAETQL